MKRARGCSRIRATRVCLQLALSMAFALSDRPAAAAETYYVRASGSDDSGGLSPQTAFATIRKAAGLLREPGDRVIVGPGTYPEGNIGPRGNGTPDDPIVFQADPSGVMTQDPTGPVKVVPPNMPIPPNMEDNTTGFLLFGKHDVVIQGFTIEAAADAGIQVRPQFSTGIDSTRITLRQNEVRSGRHGIQVLAAGDVSVEDNVLRSNTDVGLSLTSAAEIPLRPLVRGNVIKLNKYGTILERTSGGEIVENELDSNNVAIKLTEARGASISRNDLGFGRVDGNGGDLRFIDNQSVGQIRLDTTETVSFQGNQIAGGVVLSADPEGTLQLLDNELSSITEIRGSAMLELQRNNARVIDAVTRGAIIARENTFSGTTSLFGNAELELIDNDGTSLRAEGTNASVTDNQATSRLQITATVGDVRRNGADLFTLYQREIPPPDEGDDEEQTTWVVADSLVGRSLTIGTSRGPLSEAIVRGNLVVNGPLLVYARGPLQVSQNEAGGITCILSKVAPDLSLTNNTARGSRFSGLIVVGAGNALVESNTSTDNAESGIAVRRTKSLTVAGNTFRSNGTGGIAVRTSPVLGGDCNGDAEVTVNEVVVCASIALEIVPLRECDAADFDGDGLVTIDEVVRAVAGALGVVGPPPPEITEGRVVLQNNVVEDNAEFGIKVLAPGSVSAIGNRVLRNGGIGIATEVEVLQQEVQIVGNAIGSSAAEGILVKGSDAARIWNNLVFSNGQAGILLRGAAGAEVVNNLVYVNDNDGIAVGLGTTLPSPNAMILNNTLYANDGWGVTIGTADTPSEGTVILNNIFDWNAAGGVAADLGSLGGLTIGFNLNNDGYSHEVTPSVTDFPADPRFTDPAGSDGILGGDGFEDDDFLLDPASAAVDAGSDTAAALGITGWAVAGLEVDEGIVDLGFHYGAAAPSQDGPANQ